MSSALILFTPVIVGVLFVYFFKPTKGQTQLLLSFSGAFLLAITISHLMPEVFNGKNEHIEYYIIAGLLIQLIMDYFSRGAEHGHLHTKNDRLSKVLFTSLCLHAFIEGIPVANEEHHELLWAIVVHKIPITIVIASFLLHTQSKFRYGLIILLIFATMSPLGSLAGTYLPIISTYKNEITALIIGVFLHISTIIIFESTENHRFNIAKFGAILLGFLIALAI